MTKDEKLAALKERFGPAGMQTGLGIELIKEIEINAELDEERQHFWEICCKRAIEVGELRRGLERIKTVILEVVK